MDAAPMRAQRPRESGFCDITADGGWNALQTWLGDPMTRFVARIGSCQVSIGTMR
jgi:hypothetical protein